jgi:Amt family ammonium transporter
MILTNLLNSPSLAVVEDFSADFDILFMLLAGILVFFMQAGFTLLESGMTRTKNAGNIAMKNFMDISVATITFWAVGYGFVYGGEKNSWRLFIKWWYLVQ